MDLMELVKDIWDEALWIVPVIIVTLIFAFVLLVGLWVFVCATLDCAAWALKALGL